MTQRLTQAEEMRIRDQAETFASESYAHRGGGKNAYIRDVPRLLAEIDALRAELAGAEERGRQRAYALVERELRSIRGIVDYTVNTPGIRHYPNDSETSRCEWAATMIEAVDRALARTTTRELTLLGIGTPPPDAGESPETCGQCGAEVVGYHRCEDVGESGDG